MAEPEPDPTVPSTAAPVTAPRQPRSTRAVLGILGTIVGVVLLCVLAVYVTRVASTDGADVVDGVRSDRIQAVFLTNDEVYFGRVRERSGNWVEVRDAFSLRVTTPAKGAQPSATPSTQIVPVSQALGGDGNLLVNGSEIRLIQNLETSSPIAKRVRADS